MDEDDEPRPVHLELVHGDPGDAHRRRSGPKSNLPPHIAGNSFPSRPKNIVAMACYASVPNPSALSEASLVSAAA